MMSTVKEAVLRDNTYFSQEYDIIVIGAGHAGCEAALAAARLGHKTALFTMNLDAVANMPCNPNIGGTAKGQLVREIDALGGEMGKNADRTFIQSRMLNSSKGPAVLSPRAQIDRREYQTEMKRILENEPNLDLRQAEIVEILYRPSIELISEEKTQKVSTDESTDEKVISTDTTNRNENTKLVVSPNLKLAGNTIEGVLSRTNAIYPCKVVIITTGTYMESRIIIGETSFSGGPDGMFPSQGLAGSLLEMGVALQRFKTGTPVRINKNTILFDKMEEQFGDETPCLFSYENDGNEEYLNRKQISCHLTWTSEGTRDAIMQNIHRSPLYSGDIDGVGPRYCPSIEDKFVKFPGRERHQVFIEPTGAKTLEMYVQGMSSSMPEEIQVRMLQSIPGLENSKIMRPAYAIEYDCIIPTQLHLSLEHKTVDGLFCAGQINGSSGYEEAGGQGIIAGINAAMKLQDKQPVILDRSIAYIGVLIDDLVTKGTSEPYRMMTSRAEYRLFLRQDNADERLTPIGHSIGLISEDRYKAFCKKMQMIDSEINRIKSTVVRPGDDTNDLLKSLGSTEIKTGCFMSDLIKRPEIKYDSLQSIDTSRPKLPDAARFAVEVKIKYEGYIALELDRIEKFKKLETKGIPSEINYMEITGLRLEARQKLEAARPDFVGQASRVGGVSPADISVLLVYIESMKRVKEKTRNDNA
jgi:tRNA uridine 5-carboxymethylaminomethyl modification enzyme